MFKRFGASVSLLISFAASVVGAQSAPKKDIPTIAKAANGSIVTIIAAANDKPIAQGTGFLVSADGVIVTNYHVIETGNAAIVKFPDGTVLSVDGLLAASKGRDLAIIKIHGTTFRTLALGDSDDIQVGEEVVAIGNPLMLESTVSNGIISGVRTSKEQGGKFLQTSAPISPGSSGGPLFNMRGEVIGINTLYLEGGENLNFAIPVNDAKFLLSHQSAKIQNLPNERSTDTPEPDPPKPDVSTGLPSDAASPREKESGIAAPSHKTTKGIQPPSYYVRSYQRGSFIIDYDGHQIVAACREALGWSDGDKLGRPMTNHDCLYLPSFVRDFGKHIPAEQMWRGDKELRFELFGHDKADVADVLDIIAEAPIGSPLRRPSPKTSPEILKALHWIQNTLADLEGRTISSDGLVRDSLLDAVNGCQLTFVSNSRTTEDRKVKDHTMDQVDLGNLDPTSLTVNDSMGKYINGPVSVVYVWTTDRVPAVRSMQEEWFWNPYPIPTQDSTYLEWFLPAPYAARFAKALRQAITLCGGKASAF
jgi:hypothetical protein